jgi:hypothetical protein
LWVTQQTIKFHLTNVYRKLRVANRTEATGWAFTHGLVTQPERRGAGRKLGVSDSYSDGRPSESLFAARTSGTRSNSGQSPSTQPARSTVTPLQRVERPRE